MGTFHCIPSAAFACGNRAAALLSALWARRDTRFDPCSAAFVYRFAFSSLQPGREHIWLRFKERPAFGWIRLPVDTRVVRLEAMIRRLDEVEIILDITHWQSETPTLRAFRRAHAGDMSHLPRWRYLCRRHANRQYRWRSRLVDEHNRLKAALRAGA